MTCVVPAVLAPYSYVSSLGVYRLKAAVDRRGVCCAESSIFLEDVGMILSSFSMARRKVRNWSYLASTLFIIDEAD